MKSAIGFAVGLLAFLIGSLGSSLLLPPGVIITFVTAVIGSLGLLLLLGYRKDLLKNTGLSIIALVAAFLVGFGIGEAASALPIGEIFPNAIFFVFAATAYGTFIGLMLHGKKSLGFFLSVSFIAGAALTAVLFLLDLLQGQFWNGIDLNYVVIMSTLGAVAGFALGLYQDRHERRPAQRTA